MDALGGDGRGIIGIGSPPSDPEEVPGVWRDCFGADGFHGPVPTGYGDRDPVFGDHEALLRA